MGLALSIEQIVLETRLARLLYIWNVCFRNVHYSFCQLIRLHYFVANKLLEKCRIQDEYVFTVAAALGLRTKSVYFEMNKWNPSRISYILVYVSVDRDCYYVVRNGTSIDWNAHAALQCSVAKSAFDSNHYFSPEPSVQDCVSVLNNEYWIERKILQLNWE